jgi:hypothetical protein
LPIPLLPTKSSPTPKTSASEPWIVVDAANSSSSHGFARRKNSFVLSADRKMGTDAADASSSSSGGSVRRFVTKAHGIGKEKSVCRFRRRCAASSEYRYDTSVSPNTCTRSAGNRST